MIKKLLFPIFAVLLLLFSAQMGYAALTGEYEQVSNFSIASVEGGAYGLGYYDGFLYTIGVNTNVVYKWNLTGGLIGLVVNATNNPNNFDVPSGVCFDGTNYYILESDNYKTVFEYDSGGVLTGFNFSANHGGGGDPDGLDCDGGKFYVADSGITSEYLSNGSLSGYTFSDHGALDVIKIGSNFYTADYNFSGDNTFREYDSLGIDTGFRVNASDNYGTLHGLEFDGSNFYGIDINSDTIITYSTENSRTLRVFIEDSRGNPMQNFLVSIQMPFVSLEDQYEYEYTDSDGLAVFHPIDNNVIIYVDEKGFDLITSEVYVTLGSIVTRTITLSEDYTGLFPDIIDGGSFNLTGCEDLLTGVWLCKYDTVTNCTLDSQCATGLCMYDGHCSNFNYNLCDDDGMSRSSRCVLKQTFKAIMSGVASWILDNFVYVLLIVALLLGGLIFALRRK